MYYAARLGSAPVVSVPLKNRSARRVHRRRGRKLPRRVAEIAGEREFPRRDVGFFRSLRHAGFRKGLTEGDLCEFQQGGGVKKIVKSVVFCLALARFGRYNDGVIYGEKRGRRVLLRHGVFVDLIIR